MLVFLHHYRDIINKHPETVCIDATEGGAHIEGSRIMTLKDAMLTYCREPEDIMHILDTVYQREKKLLSNNTLSLAQKIRARIGRLKQFHTHLNQMMQTRDNDVPGLTKKFREEIEFLRDNITEALMLYAKKCDSSSEKKKREKQFFSALSITSRNMYKRLEKVAEILENADKNA